MPLKHVERACHACEVLKHAILASFVRRLGVGPRATWTPEVYELYGTIGFNHLHAQDGDEWRTWSWFNRARGRWLSVEGNMNAPVFC